MATEINIAGAIGATLLFINICLYNKAKVWTRPVTTKNTAKGLTPRYKAITIIYFISPPPKICVLFKSKITTKKSSTIKLKIIELIYIFDSNRPKVINITDIANRILFGIKNFLQSKNARKEENI